jgi:hypothetical protein
MMFFYVFQHQQLDCFVAVSQFFLKKLFDFFMVIFHLIKGNTLRRNYDQAFPLVLFFQNMHSNELWYSLRRMP